jgi:ABC-2 type transport system ATP-binding protein
MIEVHGLGKRFGRFEALRSVSFSVPQGSAFALIGANGAGKTTCIKILMNILEPTRGSATVLGVDSRRISPRVLERIGYVSENQEMPSRLTVAEFFDYLRPFYSRWDRGLEAEIRRQLRLPPDRKIADLSHGMRMKMALACALPFRPQLLVLDEPFNGLDPLVRDEFMEGLLPQAGEMTILISSHELHEIEGMASHLAFLDEGRLLFVQPMEELHARFREVQVTFEREAVTPKGSPQEWLEVQARGNVLSFVDTDFCAATLAEKVEAVAGPLQRIDAQPMALRSVFTTLARAARDGPAGYACSSSSARTGQDAREKLKVG